MRIGKFENDVLTALSFLSQEHRRGHPLRWVKYRELVRFINREVLVGSFETGDPLIPRSVSARISQVSHRLKEKGAVRLERTSKGQVARIHLTAEGNFAVHGRITLSANLDRLRSCYPTAKEMATGFGVSVSRLARWTKGLSYPDNLAEVVIRLQDLLDENDGEFALEVAFTGRPRQPHSV